MRLFTGAVALALGACVGTAAPPDGVFRSRVTVDLATFGACASQALDRKYPGSVSSPASGSRDAIRIVRTAVFEGYAMDLHRAGSGTDVEIRPGQAATGAWKDLSLCLPPI